MQTKEVKFTIVTRVYLASGRSFLPSYWNHKYFLKKTQIVSVWIRPDTSKTCALPEVPQKYRCWLFCGFLKITPLAWYSLKKVVLWPQNITEQTI